MNFIYSKVILTVNNVYKKLLSPSLQSKLKAQIAMLEFK